MSRRFQFSLRTLFVLMLVVAAFFGGMAVQRGLDQSKRRAVATPRYATFQKDFATPGLPAKTYSSQVGITR